MLMLIPVFWCPTYMSSWCQSYIRKPSSRSSFLATEDMSWWNIGASLQVEPLFMSIYNCYLKKKTISAIWLVQLCTVSVNEHMKTRNGIWLHCYLCCTLFVKLLSQNWKIWPKLQLNEIIGSHCIKGCSFTDTCSETCKSQNDSYYFLLYYIYFLYFSSVLYYLYIADWLSVCCFCSVYVQTQAHVRTYTQQPISQLWLLISTQWSQAAGCTEWDITCCCPLLSGCRWLEGWRRTSGPPRSHCK